MSKATDEAFAKGYQQALRDVLTKKVMEGQPAADMWIMDNLPAFTEVERELHREQEAAWEAAQERSIAEHEAQMIAEGRY